MCCDSLDHCVGHILQSILKESSCLGFPKTDLRASPRAGRLAPGTPRRSGLRWFPAPLSEPRSSSSLSPLSHRHIPFLLSSVPETQKGDEEGQTPCDGLAPLPALAPLEPPLHSASPLSPACLTASPLTLVLALTRQLCFKDCFL